MASDGIKIAIVGSRGYPKPDRVRAYVKGLQDDLYNECDVTVVSGAGRGVDTWAADEARKCGMPVIEFPADWDRLGKGAGFARNKQIVDACDRVTAFWDGESRGTLDTITKAVRAGKPVIIFGPKGGHD